jgi:hypothetical protein
MDAPPVVLNGPFEGYKCEIINTVKNPEKMYYVRFFLPLEGGKVIEKYGYLYPTQIGFNNRKRSSGSSSGREEIRDRSIGPDNFTEEEYFDRDEVKKTDYSTLKGKDAAGNVTKRTRHKSPPKSFEIPIPNLKKMNVKQRLEYKIQNPSKKQKTIETETETNYGLNYADEVRLDTEAEYTPITTYPFTKYLLKIFNSIYQNENNIIINSHSSIIDNFIAQKLNKGQLENLQKLI